MTAQNISVLGKDIGDSRDDLGTYCISEKAGGVEDLRRMEKELK